MGWIFGDVLTFNGKIQSSAKISQLIPVADPRLETVEFYKVSDLRVSAGEIEEETQPPPWRGLD